MKKALLLLFLCCGAILLKAETIAVKPDGGGSSGDPYKIANLANLRWLSEHSEAWNGYFIQTADIDATETKGWNEGKGFSPIGNETNTFSNTYDGQGYAIKKIFINRGNENNIGLFGKTDNAKIENLKLIGGVIVGNSQVGGVIGSASGTTVSYIMANDSINGYDNVGGLVGSFDGTISFCSTHGVVYEDKRGSQYEVGNAGGLAGIGIAGTISNCYTTARITGNQTVAGFIGNNSVAITNCYASGEIVARNLIGGFIGLNYGSITNCFWDTENSGQLTSAVGTGKTTAEMKKQSTFDNYYSNWDFKSVWIMSNTAGYPRLQWEEPTFIATRPSELTQNSAKTSALILGISNVSIEKYGVCWGTQPNPTVQDFKKEIQGVIAVSNQTPYSETITGLLPNTIYHYRVYATSNEGVSYYSNDVAFATKEQAPIINYAQNNLRFTTGYEINPITPSNSGGAPQQVIVSTFAAIRDAGGMAFDKHNNLYVTNRKDSTIQKITPNAEVSTVMYKTTDNIKYDNPSGIAIAADGTIFVADRKHHVIKKISTDGFVTIFAGSGTAGFADGQGTSAQFYEPLGLKFDKDSNLIVAEFGGNVIRQIDKDGMVTTLSKAFYYPVGITFDSFGNIFVACYFDGTIGEISTEGIVSTFAGSGKYYVTDGIGLDAEFKYPHDISTDREGYMYVVDNSGHTVRKISAAGNVTTLAGQAGVKGMLDGVGTAARFQNPTCVVLDSIENLYVGDGENNLIRKLTRYSISPALPAGLLFNTNTGEIRGTPTEETNTTQYTITCANTAGKSSFDLNLATEAPRLAVSTVNGALNFDGVDDYVTLPSLVKSDFTIEYWMKTTMTGKGSSATLDNWFKGTGIVDAENNNVVNDFGTSLLESKLCFGVGNPDVSITSNSAVNTGKWVHVAATWEQSTGAMNLYVNGVLEKSTTTGSKEARMQTNIRLGGIQTGGNFYDGLLDNVRIWDKVRTADEINQNMYRSIAKADNLITSYLFDQGVPYGDNTAIKTLADYSGNMNDDGAITGLAMNGATSNFVQGIDSVLHLTKEENSVGTVYIGSNAPWTATTNASWLSIDKSNGTGNATIIVKAKSVSEVARIDTVTVSINGITRKIVVSQEAGELTLDVNKISLGQALNATASISVTSNMAWKIENMPTWATASTQSGTGNASINITANEANPTNSPRTAEVTISVGTGLLKTFTITQKAMPTITWDAPAAIIYGTKLSATQLNAAATSGGNTVDGSYVYSPKETEGLSVGEHTLSVTFSPKETTQFEQATTTVKLTVINDTVIVSPNINQTKVYGSEDGELKYASKSLLDGNKFTGALTRVAGDSVGTYTIRLGSLSAGDNYVLKLSDSVEFAITPKQLSISSQSLTTEKVYDKKKNANIENVSLKDVVSGDESLLTVSATAQYEDSLAGDNKKITVQYTISGDAAKNYIAPKDSEIMGHITKASLQIIAQNTTITQGDDIPTFRLTYQGFVNGETETSLGLTNIATTTAQKGSKVGEYPIIFNKISLNNYSLDTIGGKLTINKRTISSKDTIRNCETIVFNKKNYTETTTVDTTIITAVGNDSTVTYQLLISHASGDTVSYKAAFDSAQNAFVGRVVGSKPTYYSSADSVLLHNVIDSAIKTRNTPCYTAVNLQKATDSLRIASKRFIASRISVVNRTALKEAIEQLNIAIADSANYAADLTAIKQTFVQAPKINADSTATKKTIDSITVAVNNATTQLKVTLHCALHKIVMGAAAKDSLCTVNSNYKYSKSSDDWITFSNDTLHIAANNGTAIRTGKIVFTAKSLNDTVTIVQDAPITANPLADITIISGQPNKKFWFKNLFSYYKGTNALNYSVESSDIDIVSNANFTGGFELVSGIDGKPL